MKIASLKFSTEEEPFFYDIRVDNKGDVRYYNEEGQLHRLDGPAIEWPDGTKIWYVKGKLYRLDGPAIINADGTKEWWVNNERIGTSEKGFTQEDFERWKKEHGL